MSTLDYFKDAHKVFVEIQKTELAKQTIDAEMELIEIKRENIALKEETEKLKEELKFKGKVKFEKGICWIEDDELTSSNSSTPICPQCYQTNKIINRLPIQNHGRENFISCQKCKSVFTLSA